MFTSYREFWQNILTWNKTATRRQYWWPVIINYFLGIILTALLQVTLGHPWSEIYTWTDLGANTAGNVILLLVWIATFTLKARRLHDTDRSAGWILIELIPIIGTIWFFILTLLPSRPSTRWPQNQAE